MSIDISQQSRWGIRGYGQLVKGAGGELAEPYPGYAQKQIRRERRERAKRKRAEETS